MGWKELDQMTYLLYKHPNQKQVSLSKSTLHNSLVTSDPCDSYKLTGSTLIKTGSKIYAPWLYLYFKSRKQDLMNAAITCNFVCYF